MAKTFLSRVAWCAVLALGAVGSARADGLAAQVFVVRTDTAARLIREAGGAGHVLESSLRDAALPIKPSAGALAPKSGAPLYVRETGAATFVDGDAEHVVRTSRKAGKVIYSISRKAEPGDQLETVGSLPGKPGIAFEVASDWKSEPYVVFVRVANLLKK